MAALGWATLTQGPLEDIFRLLSPGDLAMCSAVCKDWRPIAKGNSLAQGPLPWLLMPSAVGTSYLDVLTGVLHQHDYVPDEARHERFVCGSFPGGWVLAALVGPRGYDLLNIYTADRAPLPVDQLLPPWNPLPHAHSRMFMKTATMSAAPTTPSGGGDCIMAAIPIGRTGIVFWRSGMHYWSPPVSREVNQHPVTLLRMMVLNDRAEDVIYYRGPPRHPEVHGDCFCVLTARQNLLWYEPENAGGALTMRFHDTAATIALEPERPGVARYLLVSSSGRDLLMVKRTVERNRTVRVLVFSLEQGQSGEPCWKQYRLIGEALFIGRGCSRAFWTGLPSPGHVYFLDDVDRYMPEDLHGQTQLRDAGQCYGLTKIKRPLPRKPQDGYTWIWFFHPAA